MAIGQDSRPGMHVVVAGDAVRTLSADTVATPIEDARTAATSTAIDRNIPVLLLVVAGCRMTPATTRCSTSARRCNGAVRSTVGGTGSTAGGHDRGLLSRDEQQCMPSGTIPPPVRVAAYGSF